MDNPQTTTWTTQDGRKFEVKGQFYLASCDHCGWVGSSGECGTDAAGDDSDVYCPNCGSSGADIGTIAQSAEASANVEN